MSAAQLPARPPVALQTTTDDADRRRRQKTDASEQNNTGLSGRPVVNNHIILRMLCSEHFLMFSISMTIFLWNVRQLVPSVFFPICSAKEPLGISFHGSDAFTVTQPTTTKSSEWNTNMYILRLHGQKVAQWCNWWSFGLAIDRSWVQIPLGAKAA